MLLQAPADYLAKNFGEISLSDSIRELNLEPDQVDRPDFKVALLSNSDAVWITLIERRLLGCTPQVTTPRQGDHARVLLGLGGNT